MSKFQHITYPALKSTLDPVFKFSLIGERVPLLLRSLPGDPDILGGSNCPLPYISLDLLFPPTATDINETSSDTVLFFLNMPRLLSAEDGNLCCGEIDGETIRTTEPRRDELRDVGGESPNILRISFGVLLIYYEKWIF